MTAHQKLQQNFYQDQNQNSTNTDRINNNNNNNNNQIIQPKQRKYSEQFQNQQQQQHQQTPKNQFSKQNPNNIDDKNDIKHFKKDNPQYTFKEKSFLDNLNNYYNQIDSQKADDISPRTLKRLDEEYSKKLASGSIKSLPKTKKQQNMQDHYTQMTRDHYMLLDLKDRPDYQKNLIRFQKSLQNNQNYQQSKQLIQEKEKENKKLGYNIIANHSIVYKNTDMPENPLEKKMTIDLRDPKNASQIKKQYVEIPQVQQHRDYYMKQYEIENQPKQKYNRKAIITTHSQEMKE